MASFIDEWMDLWQRRPGRHPAGLPPRGRDGAACME
jgi:hypothetical protein